MKSLKALIVEDSMDDAALLLRHLAGADYDVYSEIVQTAAELRAAIAAADWDIILSDYVLPSLNGLDVLSILNESGQDIPIIIISGTIGEETAVEAMRIGANDYLMKGNLTRLASAIERETENAENRRAQKKIEETLSRSAARLAEAQRIAGIGNWEWDFQKNEFFWSEEIYRILGLTANQVEVRYETLLGSVHSDDRQKVQSAIDAALSKSAPYNVEHRVVQPGGNERIVKQTGEVEFDSSGNAQRMIGTVQDITERKRSEAALQSSETKFKQLVDSSIIGILISKLDGTVIKANDVFLDMLGYRREDLLTGIVNLVEMTPPEFDVERKRASLIESGVSKPYEKEYIAKDGKRVPVMVGGTLTKDSDDTVISFVLDISEQKRVEKEREELTVRIKDQHHRLNNMVANVKGVFWEAWGTPGTATQQVDFVSDYIETLLGYSIEEWLTIPNFGYSIIHPEDKKWVLPEITDKFFTSNGYIIQFRWVAKDGRSVWVESRTTVIRDENNQPLGLRGINLDITERKIIENERDRLILELDAEKNRLQHIFEYLPALIIVMSGPELIVEMTNSACRAIIGDREVVGLPLREALPELRGQGFFEIISKVYATGENFTGSELPMRLYSAGKDEAELHYMNLMFAPLRDANNSIVGILSYGIDVTEHVLSRIKVQESEARYRFLYENSPLPMWVFDVETLQFLSVNQAAIRHYGFSKDEFLFMTIKDIHPPEDTLEYIKKCVREIPEDGKVGEVKHMKKDGTVIDVEINTSQLEYNRRNARIVLADDITKRRRAERSIRFQAHLLNTVEQAVIATDLKGNVTYWNQFAEKLYGWTAADAVGSHIVKLTNPEINWEQIGQIRSGKSWSGELEVEDKARRRFPAYISNSPVHNNDGELTGIVGISIDVTERSRFERALRQAEDKYRNLVESSPAIIYLAEPQLPFKPIYISPNVAAFGFTTEEWSKRPDMLINFIYKEDRAHFLNVTEDAIERGKETDLEYRLVALDGTIRWVHDNGRFVVDEDGNKTGWQGVIVDITNTKELEEQLRQAQKLESVGLLAGGIAHDFNNMLTAINGYSDLTLRQLSKNDPLRLNIEEIRKAGHHSAELTQQLLAFSRQQILHPIVLDPNDIIKNTIKMLHRLIGEDIQLTTTLNSKIGLVRVDPGQFSQIIMNLTVNARDAMPNKGKLTIETANVFLDPDYTRRHVGVLPGAYVMMAISDTGIGMSEETRKHIFEPFFTTKDVGQGTGLGLATVYGIVKQSGGSIEVYSEEGIGSTFKIYLPRVIDQTAPEKIKDISTEMPGGTEIILLVEDEEIVRNLTRQILEECGYTIIQARDGLEALEICERIDCRFDLLMTDVIMPQMGGRELTEILKSKLPDLRVLFTSGYTDDAVVRHGVIETDSNFIQKPFSPETLANKVREILDN